MYEALRRKGYSKSKAARISNAAANGTLDRGHRGGRKGKFGLSRSSARPVRGGHSRGRASSRAGRVTRGHGGRRR